jgi:hypothetical protein
MIDGMFLCALAAVSFLTGSIGGLVVDSTGAVIPNAKVTVSGGNGDRVESRSDSFGRFWFVDLKPGA